MSTVTNTTIVYQYVGYNAVRVLYVTFMNNLCENVSVNFDIRGVKNVYMTDILPCKIGVFTTVEITSKIPDIKKIHVDIPINNRMDISFSGSTVRISQDIPNLPNSFPINAFNLDTNEIYPICNIGCLDEIRFYDVPRFCKPTTTNQ